MDSGVFVHGIALESPVLDGVSLHSQHSTPGKHMCVMEKINHNLHYMVPKLIYLHLFTAQFHKDFHKTTAVTFCINKNQLDCLFVQKFPVG